MTTIESEIKNIIEEVICGKYIGKLKVIKEEIEGTEFWTLLLYLNLELSPMILAYAGNEEQFKNFIRKEMKDRKLHGIHFWKALQELPVLDDKMCDNYEQR